MKVLCLSLLMLSLSAFGQAFTPRRPFIYSVPTTNVPPGPGNIPGLAYWWVASDVATNGVPVTNWVDRIQGAVMHNLGTNQPTCPTTNAVYFNGNGILTNLPGISMNVPVVIMVLYNKDNSGDADQMLFNDENPVNFSKGGIVVNQNKYLIQYYGGSGSQISDALATGRINELVIFPTNAVNTSPRVWTNSIPTQYTYNESGHNNISLRAFGGDRYTDTISFGQYRLHGYLYELAFWTNSWAGISNVFNSTTISNIHWYGTNTYGYSP